MIMNFEKYAKGKVPTHKSAFMEHMKYVYNVAYNQALEDAANELSELTSDCHVVEGHCAGWKIQKQILSLKKQ